MSAALIPIGRIRPNPANIRRDLGDLTELAASIRARGVLQPLVVRPSGTGFVVVDGHRRLAAARLAGRPGVPCLAVKGGGGGEDIQLMLAAAMHKALEPVERSAAFKALRNRGMTVAEIARATGYAGSTVTSGLLLADLPAEAKDMVSRKELTVREATDIARQVRATSTGTVVVREPKALHFTPEHRLASVVRARCVHQATRVVLGKAGCGSCWEYVIRADERDRVAARRTPTGPRP